MVGPPEKKLLGSVFLGFGFAGSMLAGALSAVIIADQGRFCINSWLAEDNPHLMCCFGGG